MLERGSSHPRPNPSPKPLRREQRQVNNCATIFPVIGARLSPSIACPVATTRFGHLPLLPR
jgi:hypothetical protein